MNAYEILIDELNKEIVNGFHVPRMKEIARNWGFYFMSVYMDTADGIIVSMFGKSDAICGDLDEEIMNHGSTDREDFDSCICDILTINSTVEEQSVKYNFCSVTNK